MSERAPDPVDLMLDGDFEGAARAYLALYTDALRRGDAGIGLGGRVKTGNLWTGQNRQFRRPRPVSSTSFPRPGANRSALSFASFAVHTSARAAAPDPVRTAYCDAGLRLTGGTMPTAR
jgi:hypothetical protein